MRSSKIIKQQAGSISILSYLGEKHSLSGYGDCGELESKSAKLNNSPQFMT